MELSRKSPFLIGENVYLRGLEEEDLDGNYIKWFNDVEVCRYNSHRVFPYYYEDAKNYIKSMHNSREAVVLAIELKEKEIHIGNVSLQKINYINRSAEFAIIIGEKEYWGKGYAKEASNLIIEHGFMEMNLQRIYCGTSADNVPMQRLAESLGMQIEGRRRKAMFKNNRYVDLIEYGILKDEYFEIK